MTFIGGKIREEVAREEGLRVQERAIKEAKARMQALVGSAALGGGKRRERAHKGELESRVFRARRARKAAARSRRRNR